MQEYEDINYQIDTTSVAVTFDGFESETCGIRSYEWAAGSEAGWSDVLPYSPVGIVMLGEGRGQAQAHIMLHHGQRLYISVVARTGLSNIQKLIIWIFVMHLFIKCFRV